MAEKSSNPNNQPDRSSGGYPFSTEAAEANTASDALLMSRIRLREQQAMADVFDRYGALVYSVAMRILKDPGLSEDVMQEVFIQVWKAPQSFTQVRGSLGAWLAVMARHRAIDRLRQRRPSEFLNELVLPSSVNLATETERKVTMEKVREVLNKLPAEQQTSLDLAFFEGLTHAEIAQRTGDPLGTVKTRIRSALASLRKGIGA